MVDKQQIEQEASFLIERLKEPSSWAGVAAVIAAFGVHVDPGLWGSIVQAGIGLAGVAAFFIPEKKS